MQRNKFPAVALWALWKGGFHERLLEIKKPRGKEEKQWYLLIFITQDNGLK